MVGKDRFGIGFRSGNGFFHQKRRLGDPLIPAFVIFDGRTFLVGSEQGIRVYRRFYSSGRELIGVGFRVDDLSVAVVLRLFFQVASTEEHG